MATSLYSANSEIVSRETSALDLRQVLGLKLTLFQVFKQDIFRSLIVSDNSSNVIKSTRISYFKKSSDMIKLEKVTNGKIINTMTIKVRWFSENIERKIARP